jgi:hypothetical protein
VNNVKKSQLISGRDKIFNKPDKENETSIDYNISPDFSLAYQLRADTEGE